MAQERIIETLDTDGNTVSRHVTISEGTDRSGRIWLVLILLVAIAAALFAIDRYSSAEITKDAAIADAANEVGEAADQVGNAAQEAVKKIG